MKAPLSLRKGIPFYHQKTALEYQKDSYERFDTMVARQSGLHLADQLWDEYFMQPILDFAKPYYPQNPKSILDLGCGVGRWVGELAQQYPKATCWGIDFSYQMLRRAKEFWVDCKEVSIDLSHKGFTKITVKNNTKLDKLNFGLAKAEHLPFDDDSQDLIVSSFLLDRLDNPMDGLKEMHRVLNTNGRLILVTPLNFDKLANWETFYPPIKIKATLKKIGFNIECFNDDILIEEVIDYHGNKLQWKCIGLVLDKLQ